MAKFVVSKRASGSSRETAELDIVQLSENESFMIADPLTVITGHMLYYLADYIDSRYTLSFIRQLMEKSGVYQLQTMEHVSSQVYLIVNKRDQTYQYDIYGDYAVRHMFFVSEHNPEDMVYLVSEHIVNLSRNCDLMERCYRAYFDDMQEAMRYSRCAMEDYQHACGSSASGYRVLAEERYLLDHSDWYQLNLKIVDYIVKYQLKTEDYRYIEELQAVWQNILSDAYVNLPQNERADYDRSVYNKIKEFIPADQRKAMDYAVVSSVGKDLYDKVEQAIVMALAYAKTEEIFYQVRDALGTDLYRVDAITDEIWSMHPGLGYIVITKSGSLAWFPDSDSFMNKWDGVDKCPYYGKFQVNEGMELLCLREYHPELFVNTLPTQQEIDKYRRMYKDFISEQRRAHPEFYMQPFDGQDCAVGDWYANGVENDKIYRNISFYAFYGNHVFTEEECRRLLSGEEVTFDDYISQTGIKTKVRGKLKDFSSPLDDAPSIGFARTDIGSQMRKDLNMANDIEEEGLPTDGGDDSFL